jgi:hypothetical protein
MKPSSTVNQHCEPAHARLLSSFCNCLQAFDGGRGCTGLLRTTLKIGGGLLALGLGLLAWSLFIEPNRLVARRASLSLPGWPKALSGLKVALVSDLHVGAPFVDAQKIQAVRTLVDAWKPDLVLIAGDLMVGHEPGARALSADEAAATLKGWTAPAGVWAVLGNHDWWTDAVGVTRALNENGIRVLSNEAVALDTPRGRLWLAGLEDAWTQKTDAEKALAFVTDDRPVLAFTHNPDVFPSMPARFAVLFAGHTHGGQVRLPLIGAPIVPSMYKQRYAEGHVVEDGRHLFVTTGVGTSIFPIRFGVSPEVALVTLDAQP